MRKLTGYIGAMIVVFALAGSILAGYALNINGTTTVINEYDNVTDVSGLYEHTNEKTYIEYNPASNYINYNADPTTFNNPAGVSTYKSIQLRDVNDTRDGDLTNVHVQQSNGLVWVKYKGENSSRIEGIPTQYLGAAFICDWFFIEVAGGGVYFNDYLNIVQYQSTDGFEISTLDHNGYLWVQFNGEIHTYPYPTKMLVYYTDSDYDYYQAPGSLINNIYLENPNELMAVVNYNGNNGITIGANAKLANGTSAVLPFFNSSFPQLNNGLYYGNMSQQSTYGYFYPKSVTETRGVLGIDYTESNRVNNYLIEQTDYSSTTQTGTVTLNQISDNDYFYYDSQGKKQIFNLTTNYWMYNNSFDYNGTFIYPTPSPYLRVNLPALDPNSGSVYNPNSPIYNLDGFHNIKLRKVLESYNIPAGTTSIKITTDSGVYQNIGVSLNNVDIDKNLAYFAYLPSMMTEYGTVPFLNSELNKKDYLIYDPVNDFGTVYTWNGTARYSGTSDDISVFYYEDDNAHPGWFSNEGNTFKTMFYMSDRAAPFITVECTQSTAGTMKYADITKGYAIKPTNTVNVVWNNTYENGDIKILFRAENTTGTYNNTLTVANNTISVDYADKRFSVTLNSDSPVDIGTWRNIVLDIDLINGKLYVLPVRTFNSFTNVVTDNTSVLIGDLVGAAPTNNIVWSPTSNSFLFNVYSTEVFMNTYGVVMVNPNMDINDYFTDLNDFYRLRMYNFAIYGESMTVNGETLAVSNGTITYDDTTLELRNISVTYADGKVTIGDNHATIDLGEITTTDISMTGNWYFFTELDRGYTSQKLIYDWDWGTFIFDNTQFCVFYLGLMAVSLIVARKYCSLSIMDYALLVVSTVIALGVQVIA